MKTTITFIRRSGKMAGLLLCLAIPLSCVNEIEVFKGNDPTFVIDGLITNELGPHQVKLAYSRTFNSPPSYEALDEAQVKITDNLGNETILEYSKDGVYLTPASFYGVVGRSYQLTVVLESGEVFESEAEQILPVAEILNIRQKKDGTNVVYSVDFQDDPDTDNFYRWRRSGTFEVLAPIAEKIAGEFGSLPPRQCFSGARPINFARVSKCWVSEFDHEPINLESDELFNGRLMENMVIFSANIDRKYDRGYYTEIEQYSLTKSAFEFWNAIEAQVGNTGTIFETNNYQIRGNVKAVADDKTLVLGYFGASAVSRKGIFVYDYMGSFGPIPCEVNNSGCYPERCMDCLKYSTSATNLKPDYWPY